MFGTVRRNSSRSSSTPFSSSSSALIRAPTSRISAICSCAWLLSLMRLISSETRLRKAFSSSLWLQKFPASRVQRPETAQVHGPAPGFETRLNGFQIFPQIFDCRAYKKPLQSAKESYIFYHLPADKSTVFRHCEKDNMRFREKLIIYAAVIVISACPATAREIIVNCRRRHHAVRFGSGYLQTAGVRLSLCGNQRRCLRRAILPSATSNPPLPGERNEFTGKKFRYRSAPQAATALKNAGFSIVTLANNHMMDFGPPAMEETRRHLDRAGIGCTGRRAITGRGAKR